MNETEAFVALNMLPRVGPVKVRRLLDRFQSPQAILSASRKDLLSVEGVGEEVAGFLRDWEKHTDVAGEFEAARREGARILTLRDPEYPQQLREIHDPPSVLYVRGSFDPRDRTSLGIVGTRKPTVYGASCTKKLAYQLAYAGITVASGLARGVDTAAHQAALAAKGRTIAVIGSGLSAIYPEENKPLADKIAGSGAVVSEFPMGTTADRQTFPMRNRIVSGLSFGLLVIEAASRSGALITANQAGEQGRSIYAVPGKIDSAQSLGTNRLIQQGAKLVTCAQDILDDLGLLFSEQPSLAKPAAPSSLSDNESLIFAAVGDDESSVDEVIARTGLPTHVVSSTLLALEIRKLVKPLPGGRFVKTL
ncbi:MAG: DNA-processing protein DprA [Terrimicrobiaceae bacterium]